MRLLVLTAVTLSTAVHAFCGFYVSGADQSLFNNFQRLQVRIPNPWISVIRLYLVSSHRTLMRCCYST